MQLRQKQLLQKKPSRSNTTRNHEDRREAVFLVKIAWYNRLMYMRRSLAFFFAAIALAVAAFAFAPSAHATTAEERAALQAQLDQIERDIASNTGVLTDLQKQRTSLERDIAILDNQIAIAQKQIKQTDLTLSQIKNDITDKQQAIRAVDAKVVRSQNSLAQLIRRTREIDDTSLATLALASDSISDVFQQVDNYATIQKALDDSFTEMAQYRQELTDRKAALEDKEDEAQKVRTAQVIAKQAVQESEKQKQTILTQTKGQEKTYQQIIADKKKQADAIRAALFGLRDSGAIPFGTAYQYAKEAEDKTGVPAAMTLAILTQETDLGTNLGSCYVTDLSTGNGQGKNSGKFVANVMKAPRDTVPFKTITEALGHDWSTEPVSCPQGSGYGGAMGPAQFIPSTWMLYKDRLSAITGAAFPNPWNARTAVFATSLYMKDVGASSTNTSTLRNAACKYFSGRACTGSTGVYADGVLRHMRDIQSQIDIIQ